MSKGKNPIWLIRKSYYWVRSILKLKSNDVVLVCFPKTGSTWTNILLYNVLKKSGPEDSFNFEDLDNTMTTFGSSRFLNEWPHKDSPRIFVTRQFYLPLFKKNKVIFLARDPKDVMASCLPFAKSYTKLNVDGTMKDIVHHETFGLENYIKLHNSWSDHIDLILKYENLRKEPKTTLEQILNFLNVERTEEEISNAIKASTLEKTRTAQKNSAEYLSGMFNNNFMLARKGAVGEGDKQFTPELDSYYESLRKKYSFSLYN